MLVRDKNGKVLKDFEVDARSVVIPGVRTKKFPAGEYGVPCALIIGKRGNGPGEFNLPRDLAIGKDGRLYVVDGGNFRVVVFDREGKYLFSFGSVGKQYGQFARPKEIAIDRDGKAGANAGVNPAEGRAAASAGGSRRSRATTTRSPFSISRWWR